LPGSAQYAQVQIRLEPLAGNTGLEFESRVSGWPGDYVEGVRKGVVDALKRGPLAGLPVVGVKAVLTGGAFLAGQSSAHAFETAARAAVQQGLAEAAPGLAEPVMRLELVAPKDYRSDVLGDLKMRRGRIDGEDRRGDDVVIAAIAPFAELLGYVAFVARWQASVTMAFSHYARAPRSSDDGPRSDDDDSPAPFRPAVGMRPAEYRRLAVHHPRHLSEVDA
jgi:elongation factor G